MVSPNEKGAAYERMICQKLSLWCSDFTREDVFWRSSMSGGRATLASRRARGTKFVAQAGDISATHKSGHALLQLFIIECKHYAALFLDYVIWDMKGVKDFIWDKPLAEATQAKRMPLVIAKQNRKKDLVFTTSKGAALLQKCVKADEHLPVKAIFPEHDWYVFTLEDFLMAVSYRKMKKLAKPKRVKLQ